jgi:hypothetical protein
MPLIIVGILFAAGVFQSINVNVSECLSINLNSRCYSCNNRDGPVKCLLTENGITLGRFEMSVSDAMKWLQTGNRP